MDSLPLSPKAHDAFAHINTKKLENVPFPSAHSLCLTGNANTPLALTAPATTLTENARVPGMRDEPIYCYNAYFELKNVSSDPVTLSDIRINSQGIWAAPDFTSYKEPERAKRIWDYIRKRMGEGRTYPYLFEENARPKSLARFLSGYATGACGSFAVAFCLLCSLNGLASRTYGLSDGSHIVCEATVNGRNAFFDPFYGTDNEGEGIRGAYFSNETGEIASMLELAEDHERVTRAGRLRIGEIASLLGYHTNAGKAFEPNPVDADPPQLTLLPGEKVRWENLPAYRDPENPKRRLVRFVFSPDRINAGEIRLPYPISRVILAGGAPGAAYRLRTGEREETLIADLSGHAKTRALFTECSDAFSISGDSPCRMIVEAYASIGAIPLLSGGQNTIELLADSEARLRISAGVIPQTDFILPPPPRLECKKVLGSADVISLDGPCHYVVSEYPDGSVPAAPCLEGVGTQISGFSALISGRTYYIQARSLDPNGIPGNFCPAQSFCYTAPAVPRVSSQVLGDFIRLCWEPLKGMNYLIFASREAGFHPSPTEYLAWCKREDSPAVALVYPANQIAQTKEGSIVVPLAEGIAHLRVVARDEAGNESGFSPMVHVPTPRLLATDSLPAARMGHPYGRFIQCVSSLGQTYFNRLPDKPTFTGHHMREQLSFRLENAPDWLTIREADGYLSGIPTQAGIFSFAIVVESQYASDTARINLTVER